MASNPGKKRRPQDGTKATLKYPPMYNQQEQDADQMRISDAEAGYSGDPFLNVDWREDTEDYKDQSPGTFRNTVQKLRKRGRPE